MAITISYDLSGASPAERNYIRSMFERFGWRRLGGSVLRYQLIEDQDEEDWLNDVIPALMLFRSYVLAKNIKVNFFTLDTNSVTRIDHTDPDELLGYAPQDGANTHLYPPTNPQSSEKRIRRGIDQLIDLFKAPGDD
jgi:hypothetical protein